MNLEDLKAGDAVRVRDEFGGVTKRTIVRALATQVVLDDGSRWTRRGRRVGSGVWSRAFATPWDEARHQIEILEQRAHAERRHLIESLSCGIRTMPLVGLRTMKQAMDAVQAAAALAHSGSAPQALKGE